MKLESKNIEVEETDQEVNYEKVNLTVTVYNNTDYHLEVYSQELSWGKFGESPGPIDPNNSGSFKAMGRAHSASGTEGKIVWRIRDTDHQYGMPKVTFKFDQPYSGSNSYETTCDDLKYKASHTIVSGEGKFATILNIHISKA